MEPKMNSPLFDPAKLPQPDENGFFFHPDIPGEDESDDVKALCFALGFDAAAVDMDGDAPEALTDSYFDGETDAVASWVPTPPKGDNWILVAKYDTEDGPGAMFVRPLQ